MKRVRVKITKGALKGKIYNARLYGGLYECHTEFGIIDYPADYVEALTE